jgi:drug/metabolite transporter (DMT)-like permease
MDHQRTTEPFEPPLIGLTQDATAQPAPASSVRHARLLALVAAILWSTSGFFVKAPYFQGWSGPALAFWRAAFACLVLCPLVRAPRWTWKLVPMSVCFVGMNYSFLTAMVKGSAANAIWLQCTAPVWALLIGVLVFHERSEWRDWLMAASAAAGVALILFFESSGAIVSAAVGWGLAAGVCYAGVILALRHLRDYDAVWLAAVNHLAALVVLAPIALRGGPFPSGIQWLFLAGLGILQMALPYVLFTRSLQQLAGHEAAGIGLIEPLLIPLWAYLAWGDRPAWWTLAGGGFILLGLAIRYLGPLPVNSRPEPPAD